MLVTSLKLVSVLPCVDMVPLAGLRAAGAPWAFSRQELVTNNTGLLGELKRRAMREDPKARCAGGPRLPFLLWRLATKLPRLPRDRLSAQ